MPSRHQEGPTRNPIQLVIRIGAHQIKLRGEVPSVEVEEIIMVVELEILVDLVEGEVVLVDIEEEEEEAALGL